MIEISERLIRIRDNAKHYYGNDYTTKLEPFTALIQTRMKQHELDELTSALDIMKIQSIKDNPAAQLLIIAAAVELIEERKEVVHETSGK